MLPLLGFLGFLKVCIVLLKQKFGRERDDSEVKSPYRRGPKLGSQPSHPVTHIAFNCNSRMRSPGLCGHWHSHVGIVLKTETKSSTVLVTLNSSGQFSGTLYVKEIAVPQRS